MVDGFRDFLRRGSCWQSGPLTAGISFQPGDLQIWLSGVSGQLDLVQQHSKDGVLYSDDDGLAYIGASEA
jgi:hypothetical protein